MPSLDHLLCNANLICPEKGRLGHNAVALHKGVISDIGRQEALEQKYTFREKVDLQGNYVYPGFIDSHGHPYYHGQMLLSVNLQDCRSMRMAAEKLMDEAKPGDNGWIIGYGWDDSQWPQDERPDNALLDKFFPDIPVLIRRVDFHAAIVNTEGLRRVAEFHGHDYDFPSAGLLKEGEVDRLMEAVPEPSREEKCRAWQASEADCFSKGITSVGDAGLRPDMIRLLHAFQQEGSLMMDYYPMLLVERGGNIEDDLNKSGAGVLKYFADGTLGSRTAALKGSYADKPGEQGALLWTRDALISSFEQAVKKNLQVCVHAIGDAAFEEVSCAMAVYDNYPRKLRWRIEHCQLADAESIKVFRRSHALPSMQPLQAVTDASWISRRIGGISTVKRFPFKSLLLSNGRIALNSDFPVESPSVLKGIAAVLSGKTPDGRQCIDSTETLSHAEALKGYSSWGAYAQFEENQKGRLENGYLADLTVSDADLLNDKPDKILESRILATYKKGVKVYDAFQD